MSVWILHAISYHSLQAFNTFARSGLHSLSNLDLAVNQDIKSRVTYFSNHGPIGKQIDGYFRFECPHCGELQATVNPKNNLAHCFCCGENTNNIDLMMLQGHDFLTAVSILKDWLNQYRHDLGLPEQSASPRSARDE